MKPGKVPKTQPLPPIRLPLGANLPDSRRKLKQLNRRCYVQKKKGRDHIKNLVEENEKLKMITYVRLTKLSEEEIVSFCSVKKKIRKPKSKISQAKDDLIKEKIILGIEDGLKVVDTTEKGRSVMATKKFKLGEFVAEYSGELIDKEEAKKREAKYVADPSIGCYMFYFSHKNKTHCIDATEETEKLGRLINHSKKGNLSPKLFEIDGTPHVIFKASREIICNEELLYDYGDRRSKVVADNLWLAT